MKPAMAKVEKKPREQSVLSDERLHELFREMLRVYEAVRETRTFESGAVYLGYAAKSG